jgi:hypothetical protein
MSLMIVINSLFLLLRYSTGAQAMVMNMGLRYLNSHFQGEIHFDSLSGNLFNEFTLSNVRIYCKEGEYEIAKVESVTANWNYREIFSRRVYVNWVTINGAYADLWFYPTRLNIVQVFRKERDRGDETQRVKERKPDDRRGNPMQVIINNVRGYNITANYQAQADNLFIPRYAEIESFIA